MSGSHPSNSPINDSNGGGGGSALNENDSARQYHHQNNSSSHSRNHTNDNQQASHLHQSLVHEADRHPRPLEHRRHQLDGHLAIDVVRDRALTGDRRPDRLWWAGGDDNIETDSSRQQPTSNGGIPEFVRPTNAESGSTGHLHTIESYIDHEDYRFVVAGVSNIHMSSPRSGEDIFASYFDNGFTHSPYSTQVEELIEGDSDQRRIEGNEVALILDAIMSETDRGRDTREETASEDIYDSQHIMVHNQRILENQIRRARTNYSEPPTRRPLTFHHLDDIETLDVPQSFESFHSNSAPLIQDEEHPAAALDQYSPTYNLGGFHQQPSMSISASYFSPSTESTIVLSSPPPGRVSGSFPYNSQSGINPYSARSAYRSQAEAAVYDGSAPNHSGGPYRPFITGRELAAQQQQSAPALRSSWPGAISPWDEESPEPSSDNEFDVDGGHIFSGNSEGGRWSTFGSVTRGNSFEEHRFRHHHLQRQYPSQQDNALSSVSDSRPAASALGLGANTLLSRVHHQESYRRGPQTSSFPGSGITNIPIPSRYINPQPFSHTQYTASTGSHIFRPRDISTGYSHHNGYRRPVISSDSDVNSQRQSAFIQSRPHSETIERAEAAGWTAPNLSSTAGSATSSQWRDLGNEYRGRADIGMKEVIRMACRFCQTVICERGMKAQLLADHTIGLMSTDDEPHSVHFVGEEYRPTNCYCKIMDTACLVCGNIIGYHITQPCSRCLNADNNGHHWLFHPEYIVSCSRWDPLTQKPLRWAELPSPEQDFDALSLTKVQVGSHGGKVILGGMVRREYHVICR